MLLTALLIIMVCAASFARKLVAEGKTFTALGNFKIETADVPLIFHGVELKTYVITYENSSLNVTIAIEEDSNCRKYLTISDKLSVQYVCNGSYFGIERLPENYAKYGLKTDDPDLNRTAYFHQKIIVPGKNDPVFCMKLIAAYYPELFDNLKTSFQA